MHSCHSVMFMTLLLALQLSLNNFYTKFNPNPTSGSLAHILSQRDIHTYIQKDRQTHTTFFDSWRTAGWKDVSFVRPYVAWMVTYFLQCIADGRAPVTNLSAERIAITVLGSPCISYESSESVPLMYFVHMFYFIIYNVLCLTKWLCARQDAFNPKTIITPSGVSFKFWRLQFPLHPIGYKDSPLRLRVFIWSNRQLRAACFWNEMQYNAHIHVTIGHNNSILCGMLRGITIECNPTFDNNEHNTERHVLKVRNLTSWHRSFTFNFKKNHQPDATIFQFIILMFVYSSTCFGRFPAHHHEPNDCSGSLWFYLRIVMTAVLCSWSGRPADPTTNTERLSPRYVGKTKGCHCSHWAHDDGRENARNMLSCKHMSK
jgi:hypothetical protein